MKPDDITVVLNGYRRHNRLTEQLVAIETGSVKPAEILLWYNSPDNDTLVNRSAAASVRSAICNYNFGVWARFAFALTASSPYVCVFDDDTIPGARWLENCHQTMLSSPGLLGTVGLLYLDPSPSCRASYFEKYCRFGWPQNGNNEQTIQVDFVGHSWFFKKDWLSHFWREIPDPKFALCGEDMHFSYMLQKYAGIKTYVPPHPKNQPEAWGSIKALEYGADSNSIWQSNPLGPDGSPTRTLMDEFFANQRARGWRLVNE